MRPPETKPESEIRDINKKTAMCFEVYAIIDISDHV